MRPALMVGRAGANVGLAAKADTQRHERSSHPAGVNAAVSAIVHEVRQPLAAIETNSAAALRWIDKGTPDLAEARESLKAIINSCRHIDNVVSSVLRLFRNAPEQREAVGVNILIGEILNDISRDLQSLGISLEIDLQKDLSEISADREQLREVILNLVSNATDAMLLVAVPERRLRITTRNFKDSAVLITVEDSGPGINRKNLNRIFEAFFTTKTTGIGLGLSICRSIVSRHGGHMRASQNGSRGAVFSVVMPIGARRDSNIQ
ncbi:MAG TPA: ATP-binding protein, partial [Pseudolabrys sp.]|nr:ATP-binding protein [Pseudolabrys sp.]